MQMFVNGDENLANFLDNDFRSRSGVATDSGPEARSGVEEGSGVGKDGGGACKNAPATEKTFGQS